MTGSSGSIIIIVMHACKHKSDRDSGHQVTLITATSSCARRASLWRLSLALLLGHCKLPHYNVILVAAIRGVRVISVVTTS
jgi:hypothetical protein